MNVKYEDFNTEDAARVLGVHLSTVSGWCKNGLINFQDVSEAGSQRPRYLITEHEVNRIKELMTKYGSRKWLLYYKKEETNVEEPSVTEDEVLKVEVVPEKKERFDSDKVLNTILYIQEIKERLEDLEAEKNQLLNELELMRKEVMSVI